MAFYPWTRFKQLFKQPWTGYVVVFAYNYLCNDISAVVQKQGYGVITFVPYMAVLSILAVEFVFSWVKDVRCLETLPRHIQDIHMNETPQTEVCMGQTHTSCLSRQRNFIRRSSMVKKEVEEAAAGNKQHTGETSGSQCLCHVKDEVGEVRKPQQSVSSTKDKCTDSPVWKSPALPKQDLSSSLGKRSRSSKGGSTNIGAGIATTSNTRSAQTESTGHNGDANDEMIESKNPQQHKSPSKDKQSTVSQGGSINSGARIPITGNQKLAQTESTSRSSEAKDELIESKNPHRYRSSSKKTSSTVRRGGSINSGSRMYRSAHTESTSQKDDVEESNNLQKLRSLAKNKCVPQVHELPELRGPSKMVSSGTDTGYGMIGERLEFSLRLNPT